MRSFSGCIFSFGESMMILLSFFALWMYSSHSLKCGNYDTSLGATFDLTELTRVSGQPAYQVEDGDIPCTKTVSKSCKRISQFI